MWDPRGQAQSKASRRRAEGGVATRPGDKKQGENFVTIGEMQQEQDFTSLTIAVTMRSRGLPSWTLWQPRSRGIFRFKTRNPTVYDEIEEGI